MIMSHVKFFNFLLSYLGSYEEIVRGKHVFCQINFHDHTLIIVFLISSLVLYIISLILTTKLTHTSTIDAQEVETI